MSELAWATAEISHAHIRLLESSHADSDDYRELCRRRAYSRLTSGLDMLADAAEAGNEP
jgi:hypothetical protein